MQTMLHFIQINDLLDEFSIYVIILGVCGDSFETNCLTWHKQHVNCSIFNVSECSTTTGKFFSKLLPTNLFPCSFNRFMFHVIWTMPHAFEGLKSIFWLTSNCLFGHFVWTGNKYKKWTIAILVCCTIFTHNKFMNLKERLVLEWARKLIFWFHVKIYCDHLSNITWMACYSYYL